MALITDKADLSQGASTTVSDAVFGTPTGNQVTITSSGSNLPTLADDAFFEIRDHSVAGNNGLYRVNDATPSTSSLDVEKVVGSNPIAAASESITTLGTTATPKSIMYDTARRKLLLIEQGSLSSDGVQGGAVYARVVADYGSDQFFMDNSPMPMLSVSGNAGEYIIGQDSSGNFSGWDWEDVSAFGIRTTQLLRKAGWTSYSSLGALREIWSGIQSSGTFEDPANDTAYYILGADQAVDNSVDAPFSGSVDLAVKVYDATVGRAVATPNGYNFVDGGAGNDSIVRNDGGSFITDGVKVGGRVVVESATTSANDGSYTALTVTASTIGIATGSLTADTDDNTATISVDNRAAFTLRLRVRDADPQGKTYGDATLDSGEELGGYVRGGFVIGTGPDYKIVATDSTIDTTAPYTGMELHVYSTPQSLGGSGVLVGGPYNFGFRVVCNGGTNQQVHEWLQRQLRRATDINTEASTYIGRALSGLGNFQGDNYEAGSVDGGKTFPINLLGGGSGVFLDGLAASSRNSTTLRDNTGTSRGFPISNTLILDFNEIALSDSELTYALYFDRTIRNSVSDLVITAGTGASGTFVSSGGNLPATLNRGVLGYVRVSGLTGDDAAMNGLYQVTALTSTSLWSVTRYDNQTIVTAASASVNVDENPIDSPDGIIVENSIGTPITGTAVADVEEAFDFSNNVQGGRVGGANAYMRAKATGNTQAQYATSAVLEITSGATTTFALSSSQERNI